jgi:hypothetical protein
LRHMAGCKNVTCFPIALSEQIGDAEIFISSGAFNASSSLLKPLEHLGDFRSRSYPLQDPPQSPLAPVERLRQGKGGSQKNHVPSPYQGEG